MERLLQKTKVILNKQNLADASITAYLAHIKKIYILSNGKGFSFNFLKDIEKIKRITEAQTDSTSKMIYISIFKVLEKIIYRED